MNYKKAKELKDAGFPQRNNSKANSGWSDGLSEFTLEEVIEELGEGNLKIERYKHVSKEIIWSVLFRYNIEAEGKTPLEAVSNLYIKFNKK